ncbi:MULTISPECIES: FHA domain-containing protein [unclassified Coleofasciculus]|uniref:FHA domain-containing protein n=1 Tax=unclassified Coleofasciculus TaxID=2692782 RepID=UPI0018817D36|nr:MULTISPECIES: FHA domain-containing protein [unclassified Coleofasciculus]MBE9127671.1 FHA domain-containing protein [Coleofasciculus sp. LEGE 07081]MBE9151009.1 FHA domain-containing protein [Coleofasciculus sp. LEGE 07092]
MLPIEPSSDSQIPANLPPNDSVGTEASQSPQGHVLIVQDDRGRHRFVLESEMYSIGREKDCDIRLYSLFVSRHHATLIRVHNEDGTDSYRIVDGNLKGQLSSNGLLINGHKHQSYELENEEEVVFAPGVKAIYYKVRQEEEIEE